MNCSAASSVWQTTPESLVEPSPEQLLAGDPLVERRSFWAALAAEGEFHGIDAHRREHRCVQVVDVQAILDGVQADLVGRADRLAAVDSAAGEPHREAVGVVVAAVSLFAHRSAVGGHPLGPPPQITSVSSSNPRCLRSRSRPAIG